MRRLHAAGDLQYLQQFEDFDALKDFVTHSIARALLVAMHRGDLPESNAYLYLAPEETPRKMEDMALKAMELMSQFTTTFHQFRENYPVLDELELKADLDLPENELTHKAIAVGVLIDWLAEYNQPRHKYFKPYDLKNAIRLARAMDAADDAIAFSDEEDDDEALTFPINEDVYEDMLAESAFLKERKTDSISAVIHLRQATDLLKRSINLFEPDMETPDDIRATGEYAPLTPDWLDDPDRFTRMRQAYAQTVGKHINLRKLEAARDIESQSLENLSAVLEAFHATAFNLLDPALEIFKAHGDIAAFAGGTMAQAYRIQSMREQSRAGNPSILTAIHAGEDDGKPYRDAFAHSLQQAYNCLGAPETALTGLDVKDAFLTLSAFATGISIAIECYEQVLHQRLHRPDAADYKGIGDHGIARLCQSETFMNGLSQASDTEQKVINASEALHALHLAGEMLDSPEAVLATQTEDDGTQPSMPSSVLPLLELYSDDTATREGLNTLIQLAQLFNTSIGQEIGTFIGDYTS